MPQPTNLNWITVTMAKKTPGDRVFRFPLLCPCCGTRDVTHSVALNYTSNELATRFFGAIGERLTRDVENQFTVCGDCYGFVSVREKLKDSLFAVWGIMGIPMFIGAIVLMEKFNFMPSSAFGSVGLFWAIVGGVGVFWYRGRYGKGEPNEYSVSTDYALELVGISAGKTFALTEKGLPWTMTVQAKHPDYVEALVEANGEAVESKFDKRAVKANRALLEEVGRLRAPNTTKLSGRPPKKAGTSNRMKWAGALIILLLGILYFLDALNWL